MCDDPCDICVWLDSIEVRDITWCSTCTQCEATVGDKCARCAPDVS